MKRCGRCKERKPIEAFNKAQHTKDGLQGYCKACMHEYAGYSSTKRGRKPQQTRTCKRCGLSKPKEQFHNTSTICSSCKLPRGGKTRKLQTDEQKARSLELRRARWRRRYERIKDRETFKAKKAARQRRYRLTHPED